MAGADLKQEVQSFLRNEVKTEASVAKAKKLGEKRETSLVVVKLGNWT